MKASICNSPISNMVPDEIPLPEEHFRRLGIASRPTFYRWEEQGLRILRVNGRRFIYASDLRAFIEAKDKASQEPESTEETDDINPAATSP